MLKKGLWFFFWIVIALGIRIWGAVNYFHVDIWSNAGWGEWISLNGSKGFFYNNVWTYSWPTQLPLINLIYAYCFDLSKSLMIYFLRFGFLLNNLGLGNLGEIYRNWTNLMSSFITTEIPFKYVFILAIKLVPILADMVIGGIIYRLAKGQKNGWIWPVAYLLSPFSIYVSAFWGQYDSVSFLFLLSSVLTIKKFRMLSPFLYSISLGIKPTSAIFIPFYLYLLWEERKYWLQYLLGGILGLGINLYWVGLFNQETSLAKFIRGRLWEAVMNKSEPRVTVNSYNFWYLFLGDKAANVNDLFIFMQYKIWGFLGMVGVNILGLKVYRNKTPRCCALPSPSQGTFSQQNNLWMALAVIGIGSWMLGMNMLERYLYAGIAFGLIACIYNRKLLVPWIGLSLMFFVNLYKNWWQPEWFDFLRMFQTNYSGAVQVIYPTILLLLFAVMIKLAYEDKD